MNFFAFILSFYLLALNCFPCGDGEACSGKETQKISAISHHEDHPHQTETCTPFCSCACCAASTFYQPVIHSKTIPLIFQQTKFAYANDNFHSYDFHSVWQPPRVG